MSFKERLQAWQAAAPAFRARQIKHLRQAREGWRRPQQVTFVFGCQRSGTKMLMRILEVSPETRIYHENNDLAFRDFELRPASILRALTGTHPAPCQVFKPICDSQQADRLLSAFPSAHGIWIYRQPGDVARSAIRKWEGHQREVIDAIAAGDLERWGWRTRRLPEEVVAAVRDAHRPDLTDYEGALLFWWIRNSFYFSLGLDRHPRMRLIRYEDLVREPVARFAEVFAHVGARFDEGFVARVHTEALRGERGDQASPRIRALCDALLARLDARAGIPAPPSPVSPVLMLTDTLYVGGAERYVVTLSNWMARAGVDVFVAARREALADELAPGVVFEDLPLQQVRAGFPAATAGVARLVLRERPAAIVAHSLATMVIARAASAGTGIPVVGVAHGWPEARYRAVAPLMRAADKVVAVSAEVRDKLVRAGLPAERCAVIRNGIDVAPFGGRDGEVRRAARARMGAQPEDLVVLAVGRLTAQKAHQHVVAIAERLRASHPGLRFAIVGPGERAEELERAIQERGLQDRVRLLGARRDVPDLMGSADIYLSCSDWEGMPLTTIEAMASGLPSVATRTEGTPLLLEGGCGLVVPVGDVAALAEGVARLADDPALRQRMGAAARERARAQFSHDRVGREIMALLDSLVHGAAARLGDDSA